MTTHQPHQPTAEFAPIDLALADIAAGRPLVVVDDEDRENEGDLIFAAEKATADLVTLMIRECGGLICVPMTGADLDRLALDQMVNQNTERMGTAFTLCVEARARGGPRPPPPPPAPRRSACSPPGRARPRTLSGRDTSSRCAPAPVACCA